MDGVGLVVSGLFRCGPGARGLAVIGSRLPLPEDQCAHCDP